MREITTSNAARLERVDLRVGVSELDVVETFGGGGRRGEREHLRRQVDAERGAVHRDPCDVAGRLSGAAADVEHAVVFANGGRGEERAVTVREGLVEASGLGGPEGAFVAVPCSDLPGVGRVGDQVSWPVSSDWLIRLVYSLWE